MGNVQSNVRASDTDSVSMDLKTVFNASSMEKAGKRFETIVGSWNKRYPKKSLDSLLAGKEFRKCLA